MNATLKLSRLVLFSLPILGLPSASFALDLTKAPEQLVGNYIGHQTGRPNQPCQIKGTTSWEDSSENRHDVSIRVDASRLAVRTEKIFDFEAKKLTFRGANTLLAILSTRSKESGDRTHRSGDSLKLDGPSSVTSGQKTTVLPLSITESFVESYGAVEMWLVPSFHQEKKSARVDINSTNPDEFRLRVSSNTEYQTYVVTNLGHQSLDCTFSRVKARK